ncbi:hypothetical protein ABZV60_00235 [Streptomyces sp. NPDC004787]
MSTDSIDIAVHAGVLSDGLYEQLAVVGSGASRGSAMTARSVPRWCGRD